MIVAQSNQIEVMGRQLIAYEGATAMQQRQILTADSLVSGYKKEVILVKSQGKDEVRKEKKKSRKFKIAAAVELIIILILL